MLSGIEIAKSVKMEPVQKVAGKIGIAEKHLELYGEYKAKIKPSLWKEIEKKPDGKLILVTAINPTPAGEGKTTVSIGLAQALWKLGKKSVLALREPSLGPYFGMKGGATGGGKSRVLPEEEINLHFTGDIHAVTAANNFLSSLVDNHIYFGNKLEINPRKIFWKRCLDLNDRALRRIRIGLSEKKKNVVREDGFDITAASEVMAVLCLSKDFSDLKRRLGNIIIGLDKREKPVYARKLKAEGAMTLLLKKALKPNLVQTLENTPVLIHGGPFANIAHGCNSVIATMYALKLGDYAITEAGFGADLGAEKFFDIKCRIAGLKPDMAVVVATIRALKYHGGVAAEDLKKENFGALEKGLANLKKHLENLEKFGVPAVVALNVFATDTSKEIDFLAKKGNNGKTKIVPCRVFGEGGKGGVDLARAVIGKTEEKKANFKFLYDSKKSIVKKIEIIASEVYGAKRVIFSREAKSKIKFFEKSGFGKLPVCLAKTQYSLSDDPEKLGRPQKFSLRIRDLKISNGAGFIVALAGGIMTMPGLPRRPRAEGLLKN